jgi:tetratricopeptide (TPR) repeat protein
VENTSLKTRVLATLERARADQQALVDTLSEAERAQSGTPERWSAKDLVVHITSWKERTVEVIAASRRGEPPPNEDVDDHNARVFEANRGRTWEEVLAYVARVYAALVAQVEALTDAELGDPQHFAWRQGRPMWQTVVGNGYSHPQAHLAQFYVERQDLARATELQEEMVRTLPALDDTPAWRGIAIYNLACFYALSGQRERAISHLEESLALNPGLGEWSREDSDLLSLHDDPAYEALYATG